MRQAPSTVGILSVKLLCCGENEKERERKEKNKRNGKKKVKGKREKRGIKERREREREGGGGGGGVRAWEKRGESKREREGGMLGGVTTLRGQERARCVGILTRSSCTISMQKFEVGEMDYVGRPANFFPYEL